VQIEALTRNHVLDYRIARMPDILDRQAQMAYEAVAPIYVLLRNLSVELPRLPLSDVLDTLLANAPLLELAAASIDGEQAVANVLKLRDLAVQLARQSTLSLRGLVCELTTRALEVPDEAESSLAEDLNGDGQGFVRLLSIHKAKGLEFPVVIVAGLQRSANRVPSRIMVHHDWSSGIVGIKVGDLQTVGAVYVSAKLEERRRAEQSRVLYVAMTRAKRRLILSAGMSKQAAQDSFLAMVAHGFGIDLKSLGDDGQTTIPIGSGTISLNIIVGKTVPLQANRREGAEWQDLDHDDVVAMRARWDERIRRQQEIRQCPPFLSPTLLKGTISGVTTMPRSRDKGRNSQAGAFIGTLAHRLLEQWNFADDSGKVIDRVASMCVELNSADTYDVIEISTVMREILEVFVKSEIYHTLRAATIVGREVPFAIPWHTSDPQHSALCPQHAISMMEGTIDLVYRLNGDIWIADYKTDRITSDEIAGRAEEYRLQAQIYTEAVSQCLGVKPKGFQFIFLRTGTVVPVLF
jgi:ATP-dependent helicase/nuclease subunit A